MGGLHSLPPREMIPLLTCSRKAAVYRFVGGGLCALYAQMAAFRMEHGWWLSRQLEVSGSPGQRLTGAKDT